MTTLREEVESWLPTWLSDPLSLSFIRGVFTYVADTNANMATQAVVMSLLREPSSPDDILPFHGSERRMPRYPGEQSKGYRFRLWDAWNAYKFAGSKKGIEDQLRQCGFPGHVVYAGPYQVAGHWSQFWILFPIGTHNVTGQGPLWSSWAWGDGTRWGPTGITQEQLFALRELVKKWKNSQWICRGLIFQLYGWSYGTGHTWGEEGLVWGGETAVVGI